MSCPYNFGWCKGPNAHGPKCLKCGKVVTVNPNKFTVKKQTNKPKVAKPQVIKKQKSTNPIQNKIVNNYVICYRGDGRSFDELQDDNGFQLWIPEFTYEHARDFILLFTGVKKKYLSATSLIWFPIESLCQILKK